MIDLTELAAEATAVTAHIDGQVRDEAVRSLLNVVGTSIGAARRGRNRPARGRPAVRRCDRRRPGAGPRGHLRPGIGRAASPHTPRTWTTLTTPISQRWSIRERRSSGRPSGRRRCGTSAVTSCCAPSPQESSCSCASPSRCRPPTTTPGGTSPARSGPLGAAMTASILLGLDAEAAGRALGVAHEHDARPPRGFRHDEQGPSPREGGRQRAGRRRRRPARAHGVTCLPRRSPWLLRGARSGTRPRPAHRRLGPALGTAVQHVQAVPVRHRQPPGDRGRRSLAPHDRGRDVERVEVICHPLVVELTGNPDPSDGLAARFSTIHGVACGILDGTVDLTSYEDDHVRSAPVVAMRSRVVLTPDPGVARDAARVEMRLG